MKRSKIKTIGYIFLQTIFMQLIVVALFGLVGCLAYLGLAKYNSILLPLLGVVAFIVMEFALICISIFLKSYGVSCFSKSKGQFNGSIPTNGTTTRIEYSYGPKNIVTGRRSIIVRKREESGGGCLLFLGLSAIVIGATGVIKFIIEALRVLCSDERQMAWEESREYLIEKMNEEGKASFFQVPIICGVLTLLLIIICVPVSLATAYRYSPDRIQIVFCEKENRLDRYGNASIYYEGTITNKGSAKVEQVEGILHLKSKDGDSLLSKELVINVPFTTQSQSDNHLEKNESWDFVFELRLSKEDINAVRVWEAELDDVEMIFEVTSIRYKTNGSVDFSNQFIKITATSN